MKKLVLVAALLAALVSVGRASASPLTYGVADDWPKFHPCGDVWWQSAKDIGYSELRMTVLWDASAPTAIPFQTNLKSAVDCALLNNITPVLSIYPLRPSAIGSSDSAQQSFAQFVALVGQAFPGVKNFIVGNEPNVNRFWQPQFANGQDAAAKDYEHTLAYSYDALKLVRPDSTVWGPAISSRGNDDANAASNPSHSPVMFIAEMAAAYKASGRTKPIFDVFNMHPYPPIQDTDPFSKPFQWPQAGAANLDRIKQALWDGFNGTAQPLPAEQAGGRTAQSARFGDTGLPIALDEVGEQTTTTGHDSAYNGGPDNVKLIDEATQASHYTDLAEMAACDPDVKALLFFPLIDDTGLAAGFQSGELYADLAHKQSYAALKQKIATANGQCTGGVSGVPTTWTHTTSVIGAQAYFAGTDAPSTTTVPAKASGIGSLVVSATANEDATYSATLLTFAGIQLGPVLTGTVQAYLKPTIKFTGAIPDGTYTVKVVLAAVTNPARKTTLTSAQFQVGAGGGGTDTPASIAGNFALFFAQVGDQFATQMMGVLSTFTNIPTLSTFFANVETAIGSSLGTALSNLNGQISLPPFRPTASAESKTLSKSFTVKKGQKLKLPSLGKVGAGTYRFSLVLKAGAKKVSMTSAPFTVSASGKLSAIKKAAAKPKVKKTKPKAKKPVKKKKKK